MISVLKETHVTCRHSIAESMTLVNAWWVQVSMLNWLQTAINGRWYA